MKYHSILPAAIKLTEEIGQQSGPKGQNTQPSTRKKSESDTMSRMKEEERKVLKEGSFEASS